MDRQLSATPVVVPAAIGPRCRSPELTYFEGRLTDELAGLAGQPPRDIVAGLQSLVVEFCRNELRDDTTMLVLRVAEPPDQ